MRTMIQIKSAKLILAVAGLTSFGFSNGFSGPVNADPVVVRRTVIRREPDSETPVSFDAVPFEVRDAVRNLGHERDVLATFRLMRGGESYYRMTVKLRGSERVVLAEPNGYVRNVEDVRIDDMTFYRNQPDAWYREYDDRMLASQKYFVEHLDRVTATVERPERMRWDDLPGGVRATCARETGGERVTEITRYRTRDEQVIYQTEIVIDNQRQTLQVLPDGRIFNEKEYRPVGGVKEQDWRVKSIGYTDLPDKVRWAVEKEAPKGRIPHVDVATRKSGKIYTVQVAVKGGTRYMTLNARGEMLTDAKVIWTQK